MKNKQVNIFESTPFIRLCRIAPLFLGAWGVLVAILLLCPGQQAMALELAQFTDSSGKFIYDKPFQRIISLYSAHTENLCSLGGQDLLVGISRTDDYPEEILTRPRLSYRDDPEKFIRFKPDLVLIRPMIERSYPQLISKLRNAGITVISLQPNGVEQMFAYWKILGALCGLEKQAEQLVADFTARLEKIRTEIALIPVEERPRVYFQSIHKKMKTFAPQSIAIFVLEEAGGINIGTDAVQIRKTNIGYYGKERLLSIGQNIDIFLAQVGRMNPIDISTITHEPGFLGIKAVRENRVHLIEESLVSRPTMRILTGIDKLQKIFHETDGSSH